MDLPLQITWRDIPPSEAVEADIREKAEKLELFYGHVVSCRVVVEAPHAHHHKGKLYRLHIEIRVPGREIHVNRDPAQHHAHEDIYVAIRDAFDAARRQLQEHARLERGAVKQHDPRHVARVLRRFPAQRYGFLLTPDNREVYFHENALVNVAFDMLDEGTEVVFVEEEGREGPQARQISVRTNGTR